MKKIIHVERADFYKNRYGKQITAIQPGLKEYYILESEDGMISF